MLTASGTRPTPSSSRPTHQVLRLLTDPTADERRVLGSFGYSRNETVLHTDASVLPSARAARASWNYRMPACAPTDAPVQVSYWMTSSRPLRTGHYLVTLNAGDRLDPARVVRRMVYEHPIYTASSVAAQRELPALNTGRTAFAGAYAGWGFHEDGCAAGVRAAASSGAGW